MASGEQHHELGAVERAQVTVEEAERERRAAVIAARAAGASWTAIATALGTTRQAAWERFRWVDAGG
jgi:DNA invertase Pin-like site-specific DNA recombinase